MKTSEFQKIIKPLVKQCIKEVMFEEGILSTIVSEVVQGLEGNVIRENRPKGPTADEIHRKEELLEQQRQERIKRLNESTKFENFNAFENTKEARSQPTKGSPLAGVDPGDPGVDISGIVGIAGNKWKQLI